LPWDKLQSCFIVNRIQKNLSPLTTAGKILSYAKQQVVAFRERVGVTVCVFKIGVTASPTHRFKLYWEKNFQAMWIIFMGNDLGLVNMLEAALISEFSQCTGCRNMANTGGEGGLNRQVRPHPPISFMSLVGGRTNQNVSGR
jgi:hypothetical protein